MKKFSFLFILSILVLVSSYNQVLLVLSSPNLEWVAKQEGISYPIGTDYNDNYLLYSLGSDDWSKTRITKYFSNSQIILNKTVDIGYAFFHATTKIVNQGGNIYLVDLGTEGLQIFKFDNNISYIASYFISDNSTFGFLSCEFIISDDGFLYLFHKQGYDILNATHGKKTDDLYKMNLDGELIWSLTFEEILPIWIEPPFRLSEGLDDLLYLTYDNKLHKINSEKGEILLTVEFEGTIEGLVTFETDACVIYKSSEGKQIMTVKYINKRGKEIWDKRIESEFGDIALRKTEIRNDKISYNFLDTEDGSITGKANEIFIIINSQGLTLVNETWYSDVYFLHKRYFSLTYSNSYYMKTYNATEGIEGTTIISKFSYAAPPYNTDSNSFITTGSIGLLILSYALISSIKRKGNYGR